MEKTMAVTYPISASDSIDKIVDTFATKFINGLYQIINLTTKFAGLIGLLILSVILIIFIPFIYLFIRRTNNSVKKDLKPIYNWINQASESDLRYAHLELEKKNKLFRSILRKKKILDKNVLTMGISSQTNLLFTQLFNLEDTLKNAAYPKYDEELSDEDLNELLSVFEGAHID
jgi:hypothetical protein